MKGPRGMLVKARTKLTDFFEENQLEKRDVPKAILIHEFLGLMILVTTWTCAFYFPPSQIKILQGPILQLERMVPEALRASMAKNELISSKIGGAYVEASCFRKLIRPATIPLKMYATLKLVLLSNEVFSGLPNRLRIEGGGLSQKCVGNMCRIADFWPSEGGVVQSAQQLI